MSVDCDARTKLYAVQLMDVAMRRASVIVNGILIPANMDPEQKVVQKVLLGICPRILPLYHTVALAFQRTPVNCRIWLSHAPYLRIDSPPPFVTLWRPAKPPLVGISVVRSPME